MCDCMFSMLQYEHMQNDNEWMYLGDVLSRSFGRSLNADNSMLKRTTQTHALSLPCNQI